MSNFHPPVISVVLILVIILLVKMQPAKPLKPEVISPPPSPSPSIQTFLKTPLPTSSATSGTSLSVFIYPNSQQINISTNRIILESLDSPTAITDWYKDKIKSLGMSATSFVQTSTNDNVLNKLVGSSGNQQVRVEISKPAAALKVKIVVEWG